MQSAKSVVISKPLYKMLKGFSFINLGNINTKVHNLLGNSKAFKLVLCYRILRGSFELDYSMFI